MFIEILDRTGQEKITLQLENIVAFHKLGDNTIIYTSNNREYRSISSYEEIRDRLCKGEIIQIPNHP